MKYNLESTTINIQYARNDKIWGKLVHFDINHPDLPQHLVDKVRKLD